MLEDCKIFTKQENFVETESFIKTRTAEFNRLDQWKLFGLKNIPGCKTEIDQETNKWAQRLKMEN